MQATMKQYTDQPVNAENVAHLIGFLTGLSIERRLECLYILIRHPEWSYAIDRCNYPGLYNLAVADILSKRGHEYQQQEFVSKGSQAVATPQTKERRKFLRKELDRK